MTKKSTAQISTRTSNNQRHATRWSFVGAFLLIGLGIGFLVHEIPAGALIGLGIGLLVTMTLRYQDRQ